MDLKRWLMALAVAALLTAPIGSSTTALAAIGGATAPAGLAYHDQPNDEGEEGEGEGEGEGEENGGGEEGGGGLPGLISAILRALSGEGGD